MAYPITFTVHNYSTSTATITKLTFEDASGVYHTANLTNFGGFLSGASAYTDNTTEQITQGSNYVWHSANVQADFVGTYTNTVTSDTYVIIDDKDRIKQGWFLSSNGYNSDQYVVAVTSATWIQISALADEEPVVGQNINFTTGTILLQVADTTGIFVGDRAFGNGYVDSPANLVATVTNIVSGSTLEMSRHPSGVPVVGQQITFYSTEPIGTIDPGSSIPFDLEYDNSTNTPGNYAASVQLNAILNDSAAIRNVANTVILYQYVAPPPPYYGDGDTGVGGDAGVSSANAAADTSCSPDGSTDPGMCDADSGASDNGDGTDSGYCLGKNTKVMTPTGYVEVADIKVGDIVLSGIGNESTKVTAVVIDPIRERRLFNINNTIVVTGLHLIATSAGWACAQQENYINRKGQSLPSANNPIDLYQILVEDVTQLTKDHSMLTLDGITPISSIDEISQEESEMVFAIATEAGSIVIDGGIIVEAYGNTKITDIGGSI